MNDFYTYAYLRTDRTPYYVGKGKNDRAYTKNRRHFKPPKDKSRIIFLKQNLTEEEAFKHEKYMIAVFGRKDLGTGILWNRTNGGDGTSGAILTEATRSKMYQSRMGDKNHFYGKKHTQESIVKMQESLKGRIPPNKGKYEPEESISPHAIYMREWRAKRAEKDLPYK